MGDEYTPNFRPLTERQGMTEVPRSTGPDSSTTVELARQLREIIEDPGFPEGSAWRRSHYDSGQIVVQEGDNGRALYFVEQGALRVSRRIELEDRRHIRPGICDLGAGDIFGELSLFGCPLRTATVTTLTPTRILVLDGPRLTGYFDAHPAQGYRFLRALITRLADRISHANLRVDNLLAWGLRAHGIDNYL